MQVITAPTLDELAVGLDLADGVVAGDPRVIAAAALLAEQHQPMTMTPGNLRVLLALYRRRVVELLDALGQHARETGSERWRGCRTIDANTGGVVDCD